MHADLKMSTGSKPGLYQNAQNTSYLSSILSKLVFARLIAKYSKYEPENATTRFCKNVQSGHFTKNTIFLSSIFHLLSVISILVTNDSKNIVKD